MDKFSIIICLGGLSNTIHGRAVETVSCEETESGEETLGQYIVLDSHTASRIDALQWRHTP